MLSFLSGVLALGFIVIGMFFFRFYQKTGDRFFNNFAVAFFLMAFERILITSQWQVDESRAHIYIIRLIASLIIIYAIVDKNKRASNEKPF